MSTLARFFSVRGRLSRIDFLHDSFLACGFFVVAVLSAYLVTNHLEIGSRASWGLWIAVIAVGSLSLACLGVRRVHDLGRSGLWVFVAFIPYLSDFFDLGLWFLDGTPGPNYYGNEPVVRHPNSWVRRIPGYRLTRGD
jgi:uncharacterized membrane protein YhaH (DUF805 family)